MVQLRAWRTQVPVLAVDVAIALAVAAVGLAQTLPILERRPGDVGGWPFVVLGASMLLLRSSFPLAALLGATSVASAYLLLGHHGAFPVLPPVLVAQYTVIAHGELSRRDGIAVAVLATLVLALAAAIGDPHRPPSNWAIDAGWIAAAILLGDAMRSRRELAAAAEARAVEAERTRDEEARRRVSEERLAIARELHDVVAHTLALINVQAGVAAHVFDSNPEQAREAFEHIRTATHATLNELRAMVGVLREAPDTSPPLEPTRGLEGLDALIARVREAGLEVMLERSGSLDDLPGHIDLAAYRVLQEALTNVIRHNGPSRVSVSLERTVDALRLRVTNDAGPDGRGGPVVEGHGITGMREWVTTLGGEFDAGALPGGGFEVRARMPVNGVRS